MKRPTQKTHFVEIYFKDDAYKLEQLETKPAMASTSCHAKRSRARKKRLKCEENVKKSIITNELRKYQRIADFVVYSLRDSLELHT